MAEKASEAKTETVETKPEPKVEEETKAKPSGPVQKFAQEVYTALVMANDPRCQLQDAKALCLEAGATKAAAFEAIRASKAA